MSVEYGVRWQRSNGSSYDSWGFTEAGARLAVQRNTIRGDKESRGLVRAVAALVRDVSDPRVLETTAASGGSR